MRRRRRSLLFAAAGGAGAALCWLPFGLAPALPLAMLLAMRGLRGAESGREAVSLGLAFGAARYAVASHFLLALLTYSPLAIAFYLMAIASILPWAILECWGAYRLERWGGLPRSIGFGLLYTVGEWARSIGDLSFPADHLAHAFGTSPAWLALSGMVGPFGMTLLVFAAAAFADRALESDRPRRRGYLLAAAAIAWMFPVAADEFGSRRSPSASPTVAVAVVQPCIDVRDKLDPRRWPALWERLETLTRKAAQGADLVIWPETSRPGPIRWREPEPFRDPEMEALAARVGVPILYGCEIARIGVDRSIRLYNGAALARPDGSAGAWYGKQRLLPFAEGVPFADWIGWDPARRAGDGGRNGSILTLLGNFTPGDNATIFEVGPARIGVLICYEGMYASLGRAYRNAGANVLAVMTNDSWWGNSVFPPWHARMVAERARELDLPVLRAANNGVSSLTDRAGRLRMSSPFGEVTTLPVEVRPGPPTPTPYSRIGDAPVLLSLATLAMGFLRGWVVWYRSRGK